MVTQRSKEERDLCEDEIHIENILVSNEVEKYYVHLHVLSLLEVNCHSSLKIKWFISLSHTSILKVRFRKRYWLASDCDACLENVIASMILASSSCPALLFGSRQNRRCLLTWASNLCIHQMNTAHLNWVGSCYIRRLWNVYWKVVNVVTWSYHKFLNKSWNLKVLSWHLLGKAVSWCKFAFKGSLFLGNAVSWRFPGAKEAFPK